MIKYCSHAKLHGRAFVFEEEMKINDDDVDRFWGRLKTLQQIQLQKYSAAEKEKERSKK